MNTTTTRATAAGSGVLAAAAGVAASSGVAAIAGAPSPVVAVGNRTILLTPGPVKDFAVRTFGENDKAVLLGGVLAVIALIAVTAGLVGLRRPATAVGITAVLGLVALAATAADQTTSASFAVKLLPAVVALVVSTGCIGWLLSALRGRDPEKRRDRSLPSRPGDDLPAGFDRRRFLAAALGTSAVVVGGGVLGRVFAAPQASASRSAIAIPRPADGAGPVPSGVRSGVAGVTSYLTPNRRFYRVDTALRVPDVPADTWRLRIHGMVDRELSFGFEDLLAERLVERRITMTCVSNEVGGSYVGNATWIGVPLADLLDRAGVADDADALKSTSADDMVIGTPIETVTDGRDALVAIAMNGEPLPLEHGFPARMIVPGLYGFVSATKWLVDIEVTRFADFEAYWTKRDWAARAPIKLASRIDVPRAFQTFPRDAVQVGGVAWAQTTGIDRVEVKVDDGPWQQARLAAEDSLDTWRQWSWRWTEATRGSHTLTVRATDRDGNTQTSERAAPRPDGSTGWHNVRFSVE